jgi:hypothetical protein
MPPETTLQQLIALLSAHSWLPVIALATLYLRKILSPASGFPITVPPRWLPVVSSTGALASGLVSSLQAGEGAGAAILDMTIMAAGGGFLDGLMTAIFDHDNAPAWARALVFVFDDLSGGGSGGKRAAGGPAFGHPKATTPFNPIIAEAAKPTPPPAAARRFLSSKEIRAAHLARGRLVPWLVVTAFASFLITILACLPPQFPGDLAAEISCVENQYAAGERDVGKIALACTGQEEAIVLDIIEMITKGKADPKWAAAHPDLVAEMGSTLKMKGRAP